MKSSEAAMKAGLLQANLFNFIIVSIKVNLIINLMGDISLKKGHLAYYVTIYSVQKCHIRCDLSYYLKGLGVR